MFWAMIGFGTLIISFSMLLLTVLGSTYLSQSLRERLDDQTHQIINVYDQEIGVLNSLAMTAYNQSSIKSFLSSSYSGYRIYTTSRDSYNYICTVSNMRSYCDMYLFVPGRNYVMGSSVGDVSSSLDIAKAPTTRRWYEEISGTRSTVNYRDDFVAPVTGGETKFACLMTVYSTTGWNIRGIIAATLEKRFLDDLLSNTLLEDRGFLIIQDANGRIAYSSSQTLTEKNAGIIPSASYFEGRPDTTYSADLGQYYLVSDQSEYGGYRFLAFADKSALSRAVSRFLLMAFLTMWLMMLMALSGAYLISRRISRPIREMTVFIHHLEENNFNGRLEIQSNDEIGELVRSFNVMLDSVQENQILRRQSQLSELQKQIDPHFLYNTLEIVKALAICGNAQAVCDALQSLGDMFRYNTNRDNKSTTTIRSELDHIQNYLRIQQIRFGERLQCEIHVDETLLDCITLKFILQPIVENSIRYAMEVMESGYILRISIYETPKNDVMIKIEDNGPGIEKKRLSELRHFLENDGEQGYFGIGLKNIAQRLRLYFLEPYGLRIDSEEGKYTTVCILIPKRRG